MDFAVYQSRHEFTSDRRRAEKRCCAKTNRSIASCLRLDSEDPNHRFQSADEMADQLGGVLREVLSRADGEARPTFSRVFSPELRAVGTGLTPVRAPNGSAGVVVSPPPAAEVIAGLPAPLADGTDPAAGYLATLGGLEPEHQVSSLVAAIAGDGGAPAGGGRVAGDPPGAGPRPDHGR